MSMAEQGSNPKGIIVAIVVILLLAAGFFVYNKQSFSSNKSQAQSTTPVPSVPIVEDAAPSTVPQEASASPKVGEELTVTLLEQNGSRQAGIATVQELGDKVRVHLRVAGATSSAEPAHIHLGKCPKPGAVKYPLTDVVNGLSETMLDVSLSNLKSMMPLAINIHQSKEEIQKYVSCGDFQ
jgi:hypothetical protein